MKRYSKILVYLLMVLPTLLMQSCLKDQEDIFDEPAATRLQNYLNEAHNVLKSSEKGWIMEYYPHRNLRYGGNVFILQFDGTQVTVRSEQTGDASKSETSYYKFSGDNGPLLTFDTYNELFHLYATPNGQMYQGYDGDFEFVIDSYNENEVVLHGKRTHNEIHMYRLTEDGEAYLSRVIAKSGELKYAGAKGQIGTSEDVVGLIDIDSRELELNDGTTTVKTSFCYTDRGIRLYKALEMGGTSFSALDYDEETEMYTSTGSDGQTISLKAGYPDGWKSYYDLVGTYTIKGTKINVNVVADEVDKTFILKNMSEDGDIVANYNPFFGSINIPLQPVGSFTGSDGNKYYVSLCGYNDDYVTWSEDVIFKGRNTEDGEGGFSISMRNSEYFSMLLGVFDNEKRSGTSWGGADVEFPNPFVFIRK